MSKAKEILSKLNEAEEQEITVTEQDVLEAQRAWDSQVAATNKLLEKVKANASLEDQERAYDNAIAQLAALDSFLDGLSK